MGIRDLLEIEVWGAPAFHSYSPFLERCFSPSICLLGNAHTARFAVVTAGTL